MGFNPEPDPLTICRQEHIEANPQYYQNVGPYSPVQCVRHFPLGRGDCQQGFVIDPSLVDDTIEVHQLESPHGCLKARLGKFASQQVSERYL